VKNCGVKNSQAETMFSLFIVALGIVFIFAIAAIIKCLHEQHKKQEEEILGGDAKAKSTQNSTVTIKNQDLK